MKLTKILILALALMALTATASFAAAGFITQAGRRIIRTRGTGCVDRAGLLRLARVPDVAVQLPGTPFVLPHDDVLALVEHGQSLSR